MKKSSKQRHLGVLRQDNEFQTYKIDLVKTFLRESLKWAERFNAEVIPKVQFQSDEQRTIFTSQASFYAALCASVSFLKRKEATGAYDSAVRVVLGVARDNGMLKEADGEGGQ